MFKIKELFTNENSPLTRFIKSVKRRRCSTNSDELDLKKYSLILKDPKQSNRVKYDIMRQLIALKQIFKGERVISVNNLSIFNSNRKITNTILAVLGCIGFVTPFAAFAEVISHIDYNYPQHVTEYVINSLKERYPDVSEEVLRKRYSTDIDNARSQAINTAMADAVKSNPAMTQLSSIFGEHWFGLIPSFITGVLGFFILPAGATALTKQIFVITETIKEKITIPMLIREIDTIINDPAVPDGLKDNVESELKPTTIVPITEEQVAQELPGSEGPNGETQGNAPPISINSFMLTGLQDRGSRRNTEQNRALASVYGELAEPRTAWGENNQRDSRIKFSGVNNTFNHEGINAETLVNARKGFSVKSGLFTTAKGRQAEANANNARLNAEWAKTNTKLSQMPEATRTLNGKRGALKKTGGRKTRKTRR